MPILTPMTGETENIKILELGPSMDPQAHFLWDEDKIEYVDGVGQEAMYDGTLEVHKDWKPKYDEVTKFYKGKKVHFGDATRLNEFIDDKYDIVFASHILEHFPYWDVDNVLASWVACLKPGGALHVLVPAIEWAAEEILKNKPHNGLLPYIHGGLTTEYDVHLNSFTMRYLRARLENAGLSVAKAVTGEKTIMAGGHEIKAQQHYCVGFLITDEVNVPPPEKE